MPSIEELRKMCKEKGITGYSKLNKTELEKLCGEKKEEGKKFKPVKPTDSLETLQEAAEERGIANTVMYKKVMNNPEQLHTYIGSKSKGIREEKRMEYEKKLQEFASQMVDNKSSLSE